VAASQSPAATNRSDAPKVGSTRTRLLDAAYELLMKDGYHATTVQAVARRAGLTTGAIYANFTNKQELMALAVLDRWNSLQEELLALAFEPDGETDTGGTNGANGANGSGGDANRFFVKHLAHLLTAPPAPEHRLLTEVTGAVLRDAGTESPLLSGVQMLQTMVRTSIEAGKEEGSIAEELSTDALVAVVVNLYLGTITSKSWGLEQPALDEVSAVLTAVNRGLAPPR
jgi:AcrR family transcriptional regulator